MKKINFHRLVCLTGEFFGFPYYLIYGKERHDGGRGKPKLITARKFVISVALMNDMKLQEIGREMRGKHHTTVINLRNKHNNHLSYEPEYKKLYNEYLEYLKEKGF